MINDVFTITKDDIFTYYPTWSNNMDPKIFKFPILVTQDYYLKSILGDSYYSFFMQSFKDNTLTPEEDILHKSYIVPLIVFGVLEETIFELNNATVRGGTFKHSVENGTQSPTNDVYKLQYKYKNYREKYEKSLYNFLKNNKEDYPLWKDDCYNEPEKFYFIDFLWDKRMVR